MFQHKGNNRSLKQNLGIASLLSFVAGLVNVVGFLSVQKLTTNVTGHFANLVGEALNLDLYQAFFYFLYILSFLLGAFFSNFIIEISNKIKGKSNFIIPILFEVCILLLISIQSFDWISDSPNAIACGLLFAMGLQNALVTAISNSVVRTTHLTGLFTDLGIELSQLFFFKSKEQRQALYSSIKLRLTIISSFFTGGILAGIVYSYLQMQTLLIGAAVLIFGLSIDYMNGKLNIKKAAL